jgi:acyl carrier protein
MGLDSVELLVKWEKSFAIDIPNAEAEQIVTVQDAVETILRHIQLHPVPGCKSQRLFYQFRQYFMNALGIERDEFKPNTTIEQLLKEMDRKQFRKRMELELGWKLPALIDSESKPKTLPIFFSRWGMSFSNDAPPAPQTVRTLIGQVLALNYERLVALPNVATYEEVEKVVMGITVDKTGVEVHEIHPHSRFTNDLGID